MSSVPKVLLAGIRPEPLASYLSALGVLRIAATQLDANVRGHFTPAGFVLSGVEETRLVDFLLEEYAPSPVLSPWNNASGFYPSAKGRPAAEAMAAIESHGGPRFARVIDALQRVRRVLEVLELRAAAPKDEEKARFLARLRADLPDDVIEWMDAVAMVIEDDTIMTPLLGSGGNEGVLEYSGVFLRSIVEVCLGEREAARSLLRAALFDDRSTHLVAAAAGQFDPGVAGGYNTGPGFEHKNLPTNPWRFVLLAEGAPCWAASLSRRAGEGSGYRFGVSPFTVRHRAAGHVSAARTDDDAQRVRGEVWMPVWSRALGLAELRAFLGEGRAEVGGEAGARPARDSIDFVEAVAALGVDRGVSQFVRYALIKRRGDSYIALPAGTLPVAARRTGDLLRDLDAPLAGVDQLLRAFPGEGPPARLARLRAKVEEETFAAAVRDDDDAPVRVLAALGRLNRELARRDPTKKPSLRAPLAGLTSGWVRACSHVPEARLAIALATSRDQLGVSALRAYLEPVDPENPWRVSGVRRHLSFDGATLAERLASVFERRQRAPHEDERRERHARGRYASTSHDVAAFLEGGVDEDLLESLLFAFVMLDLGDLAGGQQRDDHAVPADFALLKLLHLERPLRVLGSEAAVRSEPNLASLLRSGRIGDAVGTASRRLTSAGYPPRTVSDGAAIDLERGRRLAASMLLPFPDVSVLKRCALRPAKEPLDARL